MSDRPLVSIVIPVYNGSNYLAEAIDSALAQTYPNIEVIVINDGSNDEGATERIALSYGDRIRYFAKENGGVATALNLGIEKMRGEYFSWLSHDDRYYPEKIAVQMDISATFPDPGRIILFGDYDVIDEQGERKYICAIDHERSKKNFYNIFYGHLNGCSLLIPRTCFDKTGVFDPRYRTTQDYDLWCRMAKFFEFKHLPGVQVSYRIHSAQDTRTKTMVHRQEEVELYLRCMKMLSVGDLKSLEERPSIFYMKMAERFREMLPKVSSFALREFRRSVFRNPQHIVSDLKLLLGFFLHPPYLNAREFLRRVEKKMVFFWERKAGK
ncbi:MAG TPA: glycosyltransferase [bacterium]|nr:glycosyltransferase [bacterium]